MIRHTAAAVLLAVAGASVPLVGLAPLAWAGPGDTYISNPPTDPSKQDFCNEQATLANNLTGQGDYARADEVVSTANLSGCRIFTFHSP